MNEDQEIIKNQACVYFAIQTPLEFVEPDFLFWFGIEPDECKISGIKSDKPCKSWEFGTKMTDDPDLYQMIRDIVDRLILIKERLINFKQAHPDYHFVLEIVLYKGDGSPALHLDNDTLLFLGEIGAVLDCDLFNRR